MLHFTENGLFCEKYQLYKKSPEVFEKIAKCSSIIFETAQKISLKNINNFLSYHVNGELCHPKRETEKSRKNGKKSKIYTFFGIIFKILNVLTIFCLLK